MSKTGHSSASIETVPSTKRGLKDGFERVTFIVKEETAYKLNCIASIEDVFLKEIVNKAFDAFISTWEKTNQPIVRKKKK